MFFHWIFFILWSLLYLAVCSRHFSVVLSHVYFAAGGALLTMLRAGWVKGNPSTRAPSKASRLSLLACLFPWPSCFRSCLPPFYRAGRSTLKICAWDAEMLQGARSEVRSWGQVSCSQCKAHMWLFSSRSAFSALQWVLASNRVTPWGSAMNRKVLNVWTQRSCNSVSSRIF